MPERCWNSRVRGSAPHRHTPKHASRSEAGEQVSIKRRGSGAQHMQPGYNSSMLDLLVIRTGTNPGWEWTRFLVPNLDYSTISCGQELASCVVFFVFYLWTDPPAEYSEEAVMQKYIEKRSNMLSINATTSRGPKHWTRKQSAPRVPTTTAVPKAPSPSNEIVLCTLIWIRE